MLCSWTTVKMAKASWIKRAPLYIHCTNTFTDSKLVWAIHCEHPSALLVFWCHMCRDWVGGDPAPWSLLAECQWLQAWPPAHTSLLGHTQWEASCWVPVPSVHGRTDRSRTNGDHTCSSLLSKPRRPTQVTWADHPYWWNDRCVRGRLVPEEPTPARLPAVACSPRVDGPAGRHFWPAVAPVWMAGGQAKLWVWSKVDLFSVKPAPAGNASSLHWFPQETDPAGHCWGSFSLVQEARSSSILVSSGVCGRPVPGGTNPSRMFCGSPGSRGWGSSRNWVGKPMNWIVVSPLPHGWLTPGRAGPDHPFFGWLSTSLSQDAGDWLASVTSCSCWLHVLVQQASLAPTSYSSDSRFSSSEYPRFSASGWIAI